MLLVTVTFEISNKLQIYLDMKFLIVFVALFALALAAPTDVEIVHQESDVQPNGFKNS